MIFCLRQLQEKYIEQDRPLYIVFVDFTKAFNTVGRTGLWQLLRKYGCPEMFTTMRESLHSGMMVNVRNGGGSRIHLLQLTVSGRGANRLPRFSLFLCQQCLKRLSETWARSLNPTTPECRPLYSCTPQSEDKNHKYTCERTVFCTRQRTNFPLSR